MVSLFQIIEAIENEDMIEAHRLVRERKARKAEIVTEMNRLAPIIMQQGGGHNEETIHRAMTMMFEGYGREAQAMLDEQMTPEQLQFGNLVMELIGFDDCQSEVPRSVDMSMAQTMMEEAFRNGQSDEGTPGRP